MMMADFFASCDINQDFSVFEKCVREVKGTLYPEIDYLCSFDPKIDCSHMEEKSDTLEATVLAAKKLLDCKDLACVETKRTALNETAEALREVYCQDDYDEVLCGNQMNTQFLQLATLVDDWTPCFANPEHAKCITTTPKSPKPTAPSARKSKTPQNAKIQNAEIPEEQSEEENSSGTPYLSIFSITLFVCLNKYF